MFIMGKSFLNMLVWLMFNFVYINAETQNFYWRDYSHGDIPADALNLEEAKYLGQVFDDGLFPATIYPYINQAAFELNGKRIATENIKIFCTDSPERFYWEKVNFNAPPADQMKNAVIGGYEKGLKEVLHVGKVFHDGEWKFSKVHQINSIHKGLCIWDKAGAFVWIFEFQLLKYNYTMANEDSKKLFQYKSFSVGNDCT